MENPTSEIVIESAAVPRNSRKHRRLDDDRHDTGGTDSLFAKTSATSPTHAFTAKPTPSFKDLLMRNVTNLPPESEEIIDEEDIIIEDGEVVRSEINGLPSIAFLDRILSLAKKSLGQTVVIELLGRRIGYATLRNKIYELWKPSQLIKLMNIENDYFLVSFRTKSDYDRILSEEP
ncbi:hypothetical protein V6N11_070295 [Hibiscus sabdariffa]|uniref:DUF4283 domain-containing protein n=1 Tax=Hibiscus sabdariffa TaxID=183260 RepID=A0ABR2QEK9_9ROSI